MVPFFSPQRVICSGSKLFLESVRAFSSLHVHAGATDCWQTCTGLPVSKRRPTWMCHEACILSFGQQGRDTLLYCCRVRACRSPSCCLCMTRNTLAAGLVLPFFFSNWCNAQKTTTATNKCQFFQSTPPLSVTSQKYSYIQCLLLLNICSTLIQMRTLGFRIFKQFCPHDPLIF